MRIFVSVGFGLALAACSSAPVAPLGPVDVGAALAPVFQGDMPATLHRLAALPDATLNDGQRATRSCIQARFGGPSQASSDPSLPSPAADILAAYRRYWTAVLMHRLTPAEGEAALSESLVPWTGAAARDLDARANAAIAMLESNGWFALGGVTPPLRELMLWRRQAPTQQAIELPDGPVDVRITLLDDFASLGWAAWATCDRSHTGGWTNDDGIMVVASSWDLRSEDYRVSLLAHEAQHFSDRARFPRLSSPDLEYRAKLVELALANDTQLALLTKFGTEAARDRRFPHGFASYWIVERMRRRVGAQDWSLVPREVIHRAALAELGAHRRALEAAGSNTAETALPD